MLPYSGQLDPADRARTEDALRANEVKAVVATSALGMGYDKPDLAFCLHLGSPDSPVAYYQQIGRAGRALDDAVVVLLPAETDERLWEYFATASIPKRDEVVAVMAALDDERAPMSVPALESATGLRRGRIEQLLRVVAVDGVVERVDGGWVSTGAGYTHDQAKWDEVRQVRAREADIMRAYARGRGCLMMFLQQALDDPNPEPCGRCSVCTGELPEPGRDARPRRHRGRPHLPARRRRRHRPPQALAGRRRPARARSSGASRGGRWCSPTPRAGARPSPRCRGATSR